MSGRDGARRRRSGRTRIVANMYDDNLAEAITITNGYGTHDSTVLRD